MSDTYEIVLPAGNSLDFAKQLLEQIQGEGWAAFLRRVNPDAHPE